LLITFGMTYVYTRDDTSAQ